MSELVPEQIERLLAVVRSDPLVYNGIGEASEIDIADTLAAYSKIVQAVAEMDAPCVEGDGCAGHWDYALGDFVHAPDCLYLRARALRGME